MLNARYSENTFLTVPAPFAALRIVKDENEVKRVVPTLRPVALIVEGGTSIYRNRPEAVVYPMPDGELVCVPFSGRAEYEYDKARYLPKDHPIALEHNENPDKRIKAVVSSKDDEGSLLNVKDRAWLKSTIEAQIERDRREARVQGLIP